MTKTKNLCMIAVTMMDVIDVQQLTRADFNKKEIQEMAKRKFISKNNRLTANDLAAPSGTCPSICCYEIKSDCFDKMYKDWSGGDHITNSCHPVHDSAEAIDFARFCVKEFLSRTTNGLFMTHNAI